MKDKIKVLELKAEYVSGAGWQIFAMITKEVNCGEFTMKGNHFQPVLQTIEGMKPEVRRTSDGMRCMLGFEPFIQFEPKEWKELISKIFQEMVDAWNEKHATVSSTRRTNDL